MNDERRRERTDGESRDMRVIVGVTGASGAILAERLLQVLRERLVEVDLIITPAGRYIVKHELGAPEKLEELATETYDIYDTAADIASGSQYAGSQNRVALIVIPCTMNVVAKMAHGISDNLLLRVFDVALKEGKKIIIVPREVPLNENHLENLLKLRKMGVIIIPPLMTFYYKPRRIEDMVNYIIQKICDHLNITCELVPRWHTDNTSKMRRDAGDVGDDTMI